MLMDMIATAAAGVALMGLIVVLRHLTRGKIPKWALPAAIGAGMLAFSVWNEYSWYGRTTSALPEEVIILTSPTDRVAYRPWTYVFPVSTRFVALDRTGMMKSQVDGSLRLADAMIVERWMPTTRIPLAFDCAGGRRADLVDGVTIGADGALSGGDWQVVGQEDELQRAACQEGSNG